MKKAQLSLMLLLLLLATPEAAHASEPSSPRDFGPSTSVTVFGVQDFVTQSSATGWSIIGDYKYAVGTNSQLAAPLRGIPEGALITEVNFYFFDNEGGTLFEGSLCRFYTRVSGTGSGQLDCPVQAQYSGGSAPGDAILTVHPNLTFRSFADVDGDTNLDVVSWHLGASSGDPQAGIKMVSVLWQRQVTPPPGIPSFNDVPVSDSAFQFIEALFASGITAGCGGGNYCPNAPLTRRQMAVFLAKGLGLHWAAGF